MLPGITPPIKAKYPVAKLLSSLTSISNTVHTYTAQATGVEEDDRLVIIFWNGSNSAGGAGDVTAVTFDGAAPDGSTFGSGASRSATGMAWKKLPANQTCTIVVTTNIVSSGSGHVVSVTGLRSFVAVSSATSNNNTGGLSQNYPSLNILVGDIVIFGFGDGSAGNIAWSTAIELADSVNGGTEQVAMAWKTVDVAAPTHVETVTGANSWYGKSHAQFR